MEFSFSFLKYEQEDRCAVNMYTADNIHIREPKLSEVLHISSMNTSIQRTPMKELNGQKITTPCFSMI